VEIVSLPPQAGVGSFFESRGRTWRVVGRRPSTRVLLAKLRRSPGPVEDGACLRALIGLASPA
jgi:hypothetical protein